MADNTNQPNLPLVSFGNNVKEALGMITTCDLLQMFSWEARQSGETYKLPAWKPQGSINDDGAFIPDGANVTKTKDRATAKAYAQLAATNTAKTFANYLATRTPHMDIDEWYSIVEPYTIDAGHTFSRSENIQALNDPTGRVVQSIAYRFFMSKQNLGMGAITAASVQRQVKGTTSTHTFPTSQKYETNDTYLSADKDLPYLRAMLDQANVPDKSVANLILNPLDAAMFIEKSLTKIYSTDFVEAKHFKDGSIPELFGFRILKSNLVPKGSFYSWLQSAISVVPFEAQQHRMNESIDEKAVVKYYSWETMNIIRTDDNGVIWGTIAEEDDSSSSSSSSSSSETQTTP